MPNYDEKVVAATGWIKAACAAVIAFLYQLIKTTCELIASLAILLIGLSVALLTYGAFTGQVIVELPTFIILN